VRLVNSATEAGCNVDSVALLRSAFSRSRDLRAKVSASVATFASQGADVATLCTDALSAALRELMQSQGGEDLSFPTVSSLAALARQPKAASYFRNRNLMLLVDEKIQSSVTSALTHREFTLACDRLQYRCFRMAVFQRQSTRRSMRGPLLAPWKSGCGFCSHRPLWWTDLQLLGAAAGHWSAVCS